MSDSVAYSAQIPVSYSVDVCVVGGGPAGVAAAVSAARAGARVFLAEQTGCFGGMGTSGLVPCFCGTTDGQRVLGGSFAQEVYRGLYGAAGLPPGRCTIDAEKLKGLYDQLVTAEPNLSFAFECVFLDVLRQDGVLTHALFSSHARQFAVTAQVFIDCTGDGDVAFRAQVPYALGNELGQIMPSTLCSLWSNVDWARYHGAGMNIPTIAALLEQANQEHFFRVYDRHHTGMTQIGRSHGGANMGHVFGLDATDYRQKTLAYVEGRRQMQEFEAFYRHYVPGFEQAELSSTASLMGIRESRRIECDYRLTIDDFLRRASFPDEIGRFAYAVDIHPFDSSLEQYKRFRREFGSAYRYGPGESYGVPYRMLVARTLDNLLVAGRCVCTDQKMEASIRVMPGCYLTGQAAGLGAFLSLEQHGQVRGIEIQRLQRMMAGGN